ncbi:G5 domain-containing protein [Longispora sp. NPDC051575]|uniref:G5 domain-containing protein n=1 Tax=Longispora sp. NPDC051575 TaxID=3154943 RepID=UPI00342775AF
MDISALARHIVTPLAVVVLVLSASSACGTPESGGGSAPPGPEVVSATPAGRATPVVPSAAPTTAAPAPVVEKRIVTETKDIPFERRTVTDPSRAEGATAVTTYGVTGKRTLTYEVTVADGKELGRKLLRDVVTTDPVAEVTSVGTRSAPTCDPNYSGPCVPIASDVDCAGGKGNGPAYVRGPVYVIGTDIYDLDGDHDGVGCE